MLVPLDMVEGVIDGARRTPSARSRMRLARNGGRRRSIGGPVLVVPYEACRACRSNPTASPGPSSKRATPIFTPEELNIAAATAVEKRHKSIYEILVYGADVAIAGRFAAPDFSQLGNHAGTQIAWDQAASLVLGFSGVRAVNKAIAERRPAANARSRRACCPIIRLTKESAPALPLQTIGTGPQPFDFAFQAFPERARAHRLPAPRPAEQDHGQERLAASELHRHAAADRARRSRRTGSTRPG